MKALRNPFVVGALALVAVALVGYNVGWPLLRPYFRRGAVQKIVQDVGKKMIPEARPAPAPPPQPVVVEVVPKLDAASISTNIAGWVATPKRDPFQGRIRPRDERGAYPPAAELLTLSAVWRQSGASLAVINGQILSEGSDILDFKVATIEADQVWVVGPNGREVLTFNTEATAGTNRAPAVLERPERTPQ